MKNRFNSLFYETKYEKLIERNHFIIMTIRKIAFAFAIVILNKTSNLQISAVIVLNLVYLVYLLIIRPYK